MFEWVFLYTVIFNISYLSKYKELIILIELISETLNSNLSILRFLTRVLWVPILQQMVLINVKEFPNLILLEALKESKEACLQHSEGSRLFHIDLIMKNDMVSLSSESLFLKLYNCYLSVILQL